MVGNIPQKGIALYEHHLSQVTECESTRDVLEDKWENINL